MRIFKFSLAAILVASSATANDPFLDLLNQRRYDRDAILKQFERNITLTPPATPSPSAEDDANNSDESGDSGDNEDNNSTANEAPKFRSIAPQLPDIGTQTAVSALALVLPINADGFSALAANFFHDGCVKGLQALGAPIRVDLYISDGTADSTLAAYRQALTEDAGFIIGPMQKNNIRALRTAYPEAPAPTLLLQPESGANYYVLTMDIGEEVRELAQLVHARGFQVLIVADDSGTSRRQAQAFSTAWQQIPGTPLERFYVYDPDKDWKGLFEKLKTYKEEEAEQETDAPPRAIFAAGNGDFIRRARNFVPQGIPVFASSVFTGEREAEFLDNLWVMEMPWFVAAADEAFESPAVRAAPTLGQRFYALGVDACRVAQLAPQWHEGFGWDGVSGWLEYHSGVFRRRGQLAKYQSGLLQAVEP